jgi:microcystin-dependent protein
MMDDLYSCYQSYMRLYPEDPDRLTLGRWLWCPDGAMPLPFPTAFCSSRYDPNDWQLEGVGELPAIAGYSSGRGNPRYTGRTHCGSAHLFAAGSPVILRGTPAVDADGVPLCCSAPPAVGGEALGGVGTVVSVPAAGMWLKPESLAAYADGDPISAWDDSAVLAPPMGTGLIAPIKQTDAGTGWPTAVIPPGSSFFRPTNLSLGAAYSIYLVGGSAPGADRHSGPWLIGGAIGPQRDFRVIYTGVEFAVAGYSLAAPFPQTPVEKHLYSVRADSIAAEIAVDGVVLKVGAPGPGGVPFVSGLGTAVITLPQTRSSWWGEVLIYLVKLTDDQDTLVQRYLCEKWLLPFGITEMLTGSIVHMAIAATPPGYLPCDGAAYLASDFPLLAAYLGGAYDTHRGAAAPAVGHFRVPDFRGLALVGGGGAAINPTTSAYALGATGGEQQHTMTDLELPNHGHSVLLDMDSNTGLNNTEVVMGSGSVLNTLSTTTGFYGGGNPFNIIQPYGVGFSFIKT